MLKIVGTKIYLTRGDSAEIAVHIKKPDGTDYTPSESDQCLMTVKRATSDKQAVFQHRIVDGLLTITPEDTQELAYGDYYYDCQLKTAAGTVRTFIPPSLFRVMEEVTF